MCFDRVFIQAVRVFVAAVLLWSPCPAGAGQEESAPAPEKAQATYLPLDCLEVRQDGIIVRAGLQLQAPPNKWFDVDFVLCGDQEDDAPAETREHWGSLFTPSAPGAVTWDDIRFGFTRDAIASAARSTTDLQGLCVLCRVRPTGKSQPLPGFWHARLRLLVQLDAMGGLVRLEPVEPAVFEPLQAKPQIPIQAHLAELRKTELKLAEGARLCQAIDPSGRPHLLLWRQDRMCPLQSLTRGMFFQKIDSPRKARQLVELAWPGSRQILSARQYEAVASAASQAGATIAKAPDSFKPDARPMASIGYRVQMVLLTCPHDDHPPEVWQIDCLVLENGQLASRSRQLIAPGKALSALPTYEDLLSRQYDALIGQEIPLRVEITSQSVQIPCPPHARKGDWLDPSHWSGS
jgi:hypothetical protein